MSYCKVVRISECKGSLLAQPKQVFLRYAVDNANPYQEIVSWLKLSGDLTHFCRSLLGLFYSTHPSQCTTSYQTAYPEMSHLSCRVRGLRYSISALKLLNSSTIYQILKWNSTYLITYLLQKRKMSMPGKRNLARGEALWRMISELNPVDCWSTA